MAGWRESRVSCGLTGFTHWFGLDLTQDQRHGPTVSRRCNPLGLASETIENKGSSLFVCLDLYQGGHANPLVAPNRTT